MPCARAAVGPQRTEQEMKVLSRLCTIPTWEEPTVLRHGAARRRDARAGRVGVAAPLRGTHRTALALARSRPRPSSGHR